MTNILVVSDQERLIEIFTKPGFLPDANIRVTRTIEQALAAQAEGRHGFILIQERLGEISGHVLAHRLTGEPARKKPRILMLGDDIGDADGREKQVQTIPCAGMSDEEIAAAVRDYIAKPDQPRKRQRVKPETRASANPAPGPIATPPPATEMVYDVVEIGKTVAHPSGKPVNRDSAADPTGNAPARSRFQEKLDSVLVGTNDDAFTTPGQESAVSQEIRPVPLRVKWGKATLAERIQARFAGRKLPALLLLAAAVVIALILVSVTRWNKAPGIPRAEKKTTMPGLAKKPTEAIPQSRVIRSLPSFIPLGSVDAGYGKSHPGWERYLAPATEFRVYREGGAIKALQVIDRSGQGVPPGLFKSALNGIAASPQYLVELREQKGNFLTEKGQTANGAKIIVYWRMPEKRVKALVIDIH